MKSVVMILQRMWLLEAIVSLYKYAKNMQNLAVMQL